MFFLTLIAPILPSTVLTVHRAHIQHQAVLTMLEDWEVEERVRGLCFDTTAVNSGLVIGPCTFIEQKLDRPILHLACRYPVYTSWSFRRPFPPALEPRVPWHPAVQEVARRVVVHRQDYAGAVHRR